MKNFFQRRRTEREEALIDAVLGSPMIDEVLEQAEGVNLEERRALLAQIVVLDQQRPAEEARLDKAAVKAFRQFEAAEAALRVAREERDFACGQASGFAAKYIGARSALELQLVEGADLRLASFALQLSQQRDNQCAALLQFWVDPHPSYAEPGAQKYFNNTRELAATKAALSSAVASCHALQLKPLPYAEVSQALGQMCIDLAPVLAVVELNPPCLTASHHEVGAPLQWSGASRWVVEEIPAVIKDPYVSGRMKANRQVIGQHNF